MAKSIRKQGPRGNFKDDDREGLCRELVRAGLVNTSTRSSTDTKEPIEYDMIRYVSGFAYELREWE